jgi:hypothetical protein
VAGLDALKPSAKPFDWIGKGIYFWENDPDRALEWAKWKQAKGDYDKPIVIGAVIDLGNCLDLTTRKDLELVREAWSSFAELQKEAKLPMPKNRSARNDPNEDLALRFLDCAVINHLHDLLENATGRARPFDSVRGMFPEGGKLYDGCAFHERTHVQIAVLNGRNIKGVFLPPRHQIP